MKTAAHRIDRIDGCAARWTAKERVRWSGLMKSSPNSIGKWSAKNKEAASKRSSRTAKRVSDSIVSDSVRLAARNKAKQLGWRRRYDSDAEMRLVVADRAKRNLGVFRKNVQNKSEKAFDELLHELGHIGFLFTGSDVDVSIGGKTPDFMDLEKHLVIELFGDAWHEDGEADDRVRHFADHGWPCLVVWCSDFTRARKQTALAVNDFVATRQPLALRVLDWKQSRKRGWFGPLRSLK